MNFRRLFRYGLPLLELGLLWLVSRPGAPVAALTNKTPDESPVEVATVPVSEFEGFGDWSEEFRKSPNSVAIAAGVALAKERREELRELIETDPEHALKLAIPAEVRKGLPPEIVAHLETPISAAGEFEMIVTCYTGGLRRPRDAPELERFVTIGDERFRAFTFGRRAEMQTKDRISVHGIAIGDALAFYPDPVRRLADHRGGVVAEAFGERRRFADEEALERYKAAIVGSGVLTTDCRGRIIQGFQFSCAMRCVRRWCSAARF